MEPSVSLAWAGFEAKTKEIIHRVYNLSDFSDVTLATEDGQHIKAHKTILVSCSLFFRKILSISPQEKPIIYLSGVKASVIHGIVDFIYHGHCTVREEDLDSFIKIGRELEVEGIEDVALGEHEDAPEEEETEAEVEPVKVEPPTQDYNDVSLPLSPSLLENIDEDYIDTTIETALNETNFKDMRQAAENEKSKQKLSEDPVLNSEVDEVINPFWNLSSMIGISPSDTVPEHEGDQNELIAILENDLLFLEQSSNEQVVDTLSPEYISYFDEATNQDFGNEFLLEEHTRTITKGGNKDGKANLEESYGAGKLNAFIDNLSKKLEENANIKVDSKESVMKTKKKIRCDFCHFTTSRTGHLNQHRYEKHIGRSYKCDKCDYKASYNSQMSRHKAVKHKGQEFSCKMCEYKTPRKDNLKTHRCRKLKRESFC